MVRSKGVEPLRLRHWHLIPTRLPLRQDRILLLYSKTFEMSSIKGFVGSMNFVCFHMLHFECVPYLVEAWLIHLRDFYGSEH